MDTCRQESCEERAAIMEYEAGLPRARAEALAMLEQMPAEKKQGRGYAEYRKFIETRTRKHGY